MFFVKKKKMRLIYRQIWYTFLLCNPSSIWIQATFIDNNYIEIGWNLYLPVLSSIVFHLDNSLFINMIQSQE